MHVGIAGVPVYSMTDTLENEYRFIRAERVIPCCGATTLCTGDILKVPTFGTSPC